MKGDIIMRVFAICSVLALTLAACSDPVPHTGDDAYQAGAPDMIMTTGAQMRAAPQSAPAPPSSPDPDAETESAQGLYLAYAYNYALRLPAPALPDLHARHAALCAEAGPQTCRVISSRLSGRDGPSVSAVLDLRASPGWIARFRDGLGDELGEAGGAIVSEDARMEDLTTQIVDGEARLRARTALRDRLQGLLESGEANVQELIAVERELARVQADLESRQSVLAALRERVETSRLTVDYRVQVSPADQSNFAPIGEALDRFTRDFSVAVAAMIGFTARLLPWLVIILPAFWLLGLWLRGLFRRRRERRGERV